MRIMTYKDAVLEVLAEEMKRDPAVFVMAEDLHGRGGGQGKVHMVIRCPDGIVKMQGAHHTDCLEAWFAHVPGLQVVVPSCPAEGRGLLRTAIRNDNPVMFLEHKTLFKTEGEVPDDNSPIPFGKARVAREGRDVTLVVYGVMVNRALEAAKTLAAEGIDAEVLDLRTLSPWYKETVLASVRKTGRKIVTKETQEGCLSF